MSGTHLLAYADGEHLGTFVQRQGQITFEYAKAPRFPISLSMPLSRRRHANKAASAYLWGLLPDNARALEAMAKEAGTSPNSAFGILKHHGSDVAGALQLLPPDIEPTDRNKTSIEDVAERLSDTRMETLVKHAMLRYNTSELSASAAANAFKFSIAGAQPKLALTADRQGKFLPPSKNYPTTHIIKPNDARSEYYVSDIDAVEVICLNAANKLGITASKARVWTSPSENVQAIITERYDRRLQSDGTIKRLHQEDFCQALSVMPSKKYQHRDGGPGIGEMANLIKSKVPIDQRSEIVSALFRSLVFNVGILGTDAHAKNYSLLLDETISLAPLYDSISAGSHIKSAENAFYPMKIKNTYRLSEITTAGLIDTGTKMGLRREHAEMLVTEILRGIPSALEESSAELDRLNLGEKLLTGIKQFSPVRWHLDY